MTRLPDNRLARLAMVPIPGDKESVQNFIKTLLKEYREYNLILFTEAEDTPDLPAKSLFTGEIWNVYIFKRISGSNKPYTSSCAGFSVDWSVQHVL